jgi:hypothetical protein
MFPAGNFSTRSGSAKSFPRETSGVTRGSDDRQATPGQKVSRGKLFDRDGEAGPLPFCEKFPAGNFSALPLPPLGPALPKSFPQETFRGDASGSGDAPAEVSRGKLSGHGSGACPLPRSFDEKFLAGNFSKLPLPASTPRPIATGARESFPRETFGIVLGGGDRGWTVDAMFPAGNFS